MEAAWGGLCSRVDAKGLLKEEENKNLITKIKLKSTFLAFFSLL